MFVQVIEGQVSDRAGLERQVERWDAEVRPGAAGFVGSTAGVADDGRAVVLARFESADAARANSERREQDQWWAETAKCFAGEVSFGDSEEIDTFLGGGSDDAGFVQIMKGRGDRARLQHIDRQLEAHAASFRPDLLGGIRVWTGDDTYVEAAYFTSEADARRNEKNDPPPELMDSFAEFQELMADVEYIDLHQLWLH